MITGSPRTVSFPPDQMIKLGEEMLSWLESHPETLHLSQWYTIEKRFIYNEWKTFIQRPEFIPYYEIALKMVGMKYLDKTSNVREGVSQRWQRAYFKDLKELEDQDMDDEAKRKKEIGDSQAIVSAEFMATHMGVVNGITKYHSDRKIDNSNIKEETKS